MPPDPEIEEMIRRQHEIGFLPGALDPPFWTAVEDWPDPQTPRIFTTRELAEEGRSYHNDPNVELRAYRELVGTMGEEMVDRAYDNSAPLRVVWTTWELLLDALAHTEFSHLAVDDWTVSSQGFMLELMKKLEEGSE